ncbi:hypothetical protein SAMN04488490_2771 [Marinobacter sp. LV10R510-11A]|uniref:DUF6351 family protein n=1 Tax=Marinobacter sp. LV10R510-11A TaxID=1415568 RepID=UPI000BB9218C|nr:DUF6351 family protein [Marinobacter sp. LV10R510-11A]SOB77021.1 hypothetical protein SAMN04488490_2771 [Marinobacter sp. LV10R510-11A]
MRNSKIARFGLATGFITLLLSGCFDGSNSPSEPGSGPGDNPPDLDLTSLSSAPDQVSGDTVLIGLEGEPATIAAEKNNLEFWLNDAKISPVLREGRNGPEILVAGLSQGENRLELHHVDYGPLSDLTLKAYPVTGPIFSGPHQYPFVCTVTTELNKQPLVDTIGDAGFPVMDSSDNQIGLSKDCSIDSYVEFVYRTTEGNWAPLPDDGSRPADMATTELTDGRTVDFIVRQERGTINRFIYSFATLASLGDETDDAATENWNGRLLFHFEGGETALMVKEHFIKRFGVPDYTVAIGGSGGGIQQYVYSQNHPDLLEYYMDVTDKDNAKWQTTTNRTWLVGLNATDAYTDPFAEAKTMLGFSTAPGMTECVPAWRGLTPLVMNPSFGEARNQQLMQPDGVMKTVQWSHYDDLRNIYGVDENGNPRTLDDNVGVQYGLGALRDSNITRDEFLKLNAQIGGWKHPSEMVQEGFPFIGSEEDVQAGRVEFDPWSFRNMNLSPDGAQPAPRTKGDLKAIQAAYESGMEFDGELNMPVIDSRHYLEEVLDMHNSHQSFSVRQRIINKMGNADNQVIWFTDTRPTDTSNPKEPKPDKSSDPTGDGVWNGILGYQPDGACIEKFETYTTSRMVRWRADRRQCFQVRS